MTTDEKRLCRRELINKWIHFGLTSFVDLAYYVRSDEVDTYGVSLNLYVVN